MIRLAKPWIGDEELAGVAEVLRSGMLVQGARVAALEARLAERCGRAHAVACGSGTSALELALAALGVTDGEVLCPDLSWPSPAHAIVRSGAHPRLIDVDPRTWNARADALAEATTEQTRAAVVIDQFGSPADHPAIAEALEVPMVVDAACSLGAAVGGRPAPSFGAVACLSFHPRKLITTGEGGACLTDDPAIAERLRMLRNHGQQAPGDFGVPAGNHRMTEIAAALGLAQLDRLDGILARRRALAERYRARLGAFSLQAPVEGATGNWQTFGVVLGEGTDASARDALVARLRDDGVEAGRLSYALHRIGSLEGRWRGGPAFPHADAIEGRGLALPMHPLLEDREVDRVVEAFERAVDDLGIQP
ncbi:MAG TPA: DegT/DnrJ/EryC1/StrS family aminotransferase [Sandaracinaceae bacterium LLY-WYZ-13_1]|nr:DegT/DnrJ/EryC1/StrS family aminotransferase [Sandaracinaceae bacterium LLY-WYZ-13_1]